ncbi:MAG TPA: hypothetical protein EYN67_06705 [Flavobacteriales bacterium]|nr:hypothetical protein [Flavobacteriales bacterium]
MNHDRFSFLTPDDVRKVMFFIDVCKPSAQIGHRPGYTPKIPPPKKQKVKQWLARFTQVMEKNPHVFKNSEDEFLFFLGLHKTGIISEFELRSELIRSARSDLITTRIKGTVCPCCDQHVKEYRRSLSSNSAKFLGSLTKKYMENIMGHVDDNDGWIHYKDCEFSSRDYPALAWWGLAVTNRDKTRKKRMTGLWKPTELGLDFISGKVKVYKHLFTYNGDVTRIDQSSVMISFADVCGNHFDYEELMNSYKEYVLYTNFVPVQPLENSGDNR